MKTYRINYVNGLEKTYIGDVEAFEMIIGTMDNLPKKGQELMITASYGGEILGKDENGCYISSTSWLSQDCVSG